MTSYHANICYVSVLLFGMCIKMIYIIYLLPKWLPIRS